MDIEKVTPEVIIANKIVLLDHRETRNRQQSQIVKRKYPKNSASIESLEVPFPVLRVIENAAYQKSGKHKECRDGKECNSHNSLEEPELYRAGMRQQTWPKVVGEKDQ